MLIPHRFQFQSCRTFVPPPCSASAVTRIRRVLLYIHIYVYNKRERFLNPKNVERTKDWMIEMQNAFQGFRCNMSFQGLRCKMCFPKGGDARFDIFKGLVVPLEWVTSYNYIYLYTYILHTKLRRNKCINKACQLQSQLKK